MVPVVRGRQAYEVNPRKENLHYLPISYFLKLIVWLELYTYYHWKEQRKAHLDLSLLKPPILPGQIFSKSFWRTR